MRIFLIGFMGSGKSTIGKQLASRLNYQFIDQDEMIEKQYSMTINEVFASFGEAKFRETEHEVLRNLSDLNNVIIATGGGAPCFFNNMVLMNQHGITIYLKADPKTLVSRLKDAHDTRPLINGKTGPELLQYVTEKLAERETYYAQCKYTVQAKDMRVEDILMLLPKKM
jgi:shikimate kinase